MNSLATTKGSAIRQSAPFAAEGVPLRVLIVEDSETDTEVLVHHLKREGFEPVHKRVDTAKTLKDALKRSTWDIVVSDYEIPGFGALSALSIVRKASIDLPFIILSGAVGEETAVEAMRLGAQDFITKGNTARLVPAINRELGEAKLRAERRAERKRADRLARRLETEKMVVAGMKEIDQLKDHFVEAVTHELRTPMTPLKSAIELILDGDTENLTPQQTKLLEMMQRNVERLSSFSADILVLSRIHRGHQTLYPQIVSLRETGMPVVRLFRRKAEEKKISISVDIPSEICVFADAVALAQIVTNLLNNAIIHTREGTKMTISAQATDGNLVQVSVSDDGEGIPQESIGKVFDRFYQVNKKSGPGYRGIGLGLSVCKALIQKMGGDITVESQQGKGTTFRFTLLDESAAGLDHTGVSEVR